MTFDQILQELQKGQYRPVYFLHGEESYFIDVLSNYLENQVLSEAEKAFNLTVLYGKDADHLAVVDAARRYPMGASRQVVMVKEAQDMRNLKDLESYVEKPMPSTILVLCHKHKRYTFTTKFGKALQRQAVVFESKPLYDNQVPDWIQDYLRAKKLRITPQAAGLIAEYLGAELSKVANELDKLAINLPEGVEVSEQLVEQQIGISKDYNIYELQRALSNRDILRANRIANYFAANPKKNSLPVVLGSLYGYFSKVYMLHFLKNLPEAEVLEALKLRSAFFLKEYRLAVRSFPLAKTEQIIGMLREYDLKAKGVGYNSTGKAEGELIREMVWRVLHD